jgi:hypothetical protein
MVANVLKFDLEDLAAVVVVVAGVLALVVAIASAFLMGDRTLAIVSAKPKGADTPREMRTARPESRGRSSSSRRQTQEDEDYYSYYSDYDDYSEDSHRRDRRRRRERR